MGFDYEICYKKGKENVVADGLSTATSSQLMALTLSEISLDLLEQVKKSWVEDVEV